MKRKNALIAGIFLLIMGIVAGFSFGYVHGNIVEEGDAAQTFSNLQSSRMLFMGGIAGWLIIFICDVVVAWALYYFFREVMRGLSLATAWIRTAYAVILGIAIYNLVVIVPMVTPGEVPGQELITRVSGHLTLFETIWSAGLVIFGIHLLGLGYLSLRSGYVPQIFGWLLLFAGLSYLILNLVKTFAPDQAGAVAPVETVLSVPMAIAEIGFAVWLIVRGGRTSPVIVKSL